MRDAVVDFVKRFSARTELSVRWVLARMSLAPTQFYRWTGRYGSVNRHNGQIPRDHWLLPEERQAIVAYYHQYAPEGYRRISFMMLDADVVAVSPSTVYRVLKAEGLIDRWNRKVSKKGTGFHQPLRPHEHWHIDISYINLAGTFYYLCSILDGASRFIVHWELKERMTEADVELVIQRAREQYPDEHPRIISDNGPQFIARDFKDFIREAGMTHVRTSPYYPQSLEEALRLMERFVEYYNFRRLHSAIGYVAPAAVLAGRAEAIWATRDRKLEAARCRRQRRWKEESTRTTSQNGPQSTIVTQDVSDPSLQHALAVH